MQGVLRTRSRGMLGDVRTNVLASFLDHDDFIVRGVDERGMVITGGYNLQLCWSTAAAAADDLRGVE